MKKRLNGFRTLATVIAALMLSGPATAGESVPFKGQSSGVVKTVGFDPEAGIIYTHEEGEGEATHVGHFTLTGDAKIDAQTGIVQETLRLTAADGDMLVLTMVARGVDATHGIGTVTIVGGTGRFQGATGSFQRETTFEFPPGPPEVPITDVLEGRISFGRQ